MSEFLFQRSQRRLIGEEEVGLDLEYDGTFQPAGSGAGFIRECILEMRSLLESVQAGETPLSALVKHATALAEAIEGSRTQCGIEANRMPAHRDFFLANAAAYERCQAGLSTMVLAVHQDNLEALLEGMAAFEAGVADIDALIAAKKLEEDG